MPAESILSQSGSETRPGRAQQMATRIIFLLSGFAMSAWAPLVPFVKLRLDISAGTLGLLLLCLGAGSTFSMPLTGYLTSRFGCKPVIILATVILCLDLPLLTLMNTPAGMALALLIFGMSIGMVDVAMNVHAVVVEKASGRAMMSGFHGFFSIGCILGALAVSGMLTLNLSPLIASLIVIALVLVSLARISKDFWQDTKRKSGEPMLVMPRGWVIFLGLLCFVMFLTEGAMLDWSALFLTDARGVNPDHAGLGYTLFAVAMTIGRLTGDKTVNYFGRFKVLLVGSLAAAAGLLLAVSVDSLYAVAVGFVMVGLGAANLVPIMFSAAGNQTTMPANLAIASVTTLGYAGILAGPALVGFIAEFSSLPFALGCVAALLLLVTASARAVTR